VDRQIVLRRVVVILLTSVLTTLVAEAAIRALDGYELFSYRLRRSADHAQTTRQELERPVLRHVEAITLADGVERAWYMSNPPRIPTIPLASALAARLQRYPTDQIGAVVLWNPEYLRRHLCAGDTRGSLGILSDFYVYQPTEPGPYPIYQHMPHISPPGSFMTNAFGWRGPDVPLRKPPDTIRIAFVGASTTVDDYGFPFSHPELVGHWLNLWADARHLPYRFEVLNTGRTGIDSSSIAAVVRQELVPVDPDLVIYYEGANEFAPGAMLAWPRALPAKPAMTFRTRTAAEDYSAMVRRVLDAVLIASSDDGAEPRKPRAETRWPPDVDERNPDVRHVPLPMGLHEVVANLESMRMSLAAIGAELAISSFIWMVYDGMRLNLSRHLTLYRYLNDTYWPSSYRHMRRMADFQNRVFEIYSATHGLVFLDIAKPFPRDPDLFGDAVHMTQNGLRLQAWMYLQQLVPIIEGRLRSARWPRRPRAAAAFPASSEPRVVSRAEILSHCR
jgi:hypothetical protein